MQQKNFDRFLMLCSVTYVTLPVIIFALGWIRYYYSVPAVLVLIYFMYSIYNELASQDNCMIDKNSAKFWLISGAVILLWVYFSGIGGFGYQNLDFWARNPIYHDLCNYEWPVTYDLQFQEWSGIAALSYYFSWWLPPAFISKIFALGLSGQEILLYCWAVIGVFLIFYNLCRFFNKKLYIILIIFIFFSGLDIIGYVVREILTGGHNIRFPRILAEDIEWWSGFFSVYAANTQRLFWNFNQSIGTWLIVILFLQLNTNKNSQALSSLTFAYSPWATLGMIPISIASIFHENRKFKDALTVQNIAVPIMMAVLYGIFYLSSNGAVNKADTGFTLKDFTHIVVYICFITLEFGLYFLAMGKSAMKYNFYYVVLFELLLIPLYRLISYDFIMYTPMPAMFILMIFVIKFLLENVNKARKIILAVFLVIGAVTPIFGINRSVGFYLIEHNLIKIDLNKYSHSISKGLRKGLIIDPMGSMGNFNTANIGEDMKFNATYYFIFDYKQSKFYKYLAK